MKQEKPDKGHRAMTAVGIALCVILLPFLIVNMTLLVKSAADRDKVPDFGGWMPMIVLSDSMSPVIESGDMILCRTVDAQDVQVGDVISFYDPAGSGTAVVTHRVTEIFTENGGLAFRTKGDFNNTEDPLPVPAEKLVARFTGRRFVGVGNVAMFMQTTTGLIVCVLVPLLLLVGYDLLRRRRFEKRNKADTDALLAELEALRAEKAAAEAKK